jgi:hypothetical protein
MYLGDRHRRRAARNAGRHSLGTADGPQRVKLFLDRPDGIYRVTLFAMRRASDKGGGGA